MQKFYFNTLSPAEKKQIRYIRARGTGRSSRRIPPLSPWDFGISMPWLEEKRQLPENEILLTDWATHGNPPNFEAWSFRNALGMTSQLENALATAGGLDDIARLTGTLETGDDGEIRLDSVNTAARA
jgi:hypothetical protein